jgi:WD40 repeat protein
MKATRVAVLAVVLASVILYSGGRADLPEPVVLKGHSKAVSSVAWAADGKAVATAGDDRTIRMWDPATGRQTAVLSETARKGTRGPVVAFSADLETAAVNFLGEISIRTVADGKVLLKIDALLDRGQASTHRPNVYALAFSPDGRRLATAGSVAGASLPGGIVIIWDVQTGKIRHQTGRLSTGAGSVAWSTNGKLLAAGTNGVGSERPEAGEGLVWDAETGKELHRFSVNPEVRPGEWVSAGDVAFGPDGKRVAAAVTAGSRATPGGLVIEDKGASIRLWDLGTGKSTLLVTRLKASVGRLVFSPDGKSLATAGRDKTVRMWNVETGQELAALLCPDRVDVVAFSPDGKRLAAGSKDGSVRIWAVPAAK